MFISIVIGLFQEYLGALTSLRMSNIITQTTMDRWIAPVATHPFSVVVYARRGMYKFERTTGIVTNSALEAYA